MSGDTEGPAAGRSALRGHVKAGRYGAPDPEGGPGVVLEERRPGALVQINGADDPEALGRALSPLGLAGGPRRNRAVCGERADLLWTGAGQWWVVGRGPEPGAAELRALAGDPEVTTIDLGHARTLLRASGPMARELLAKGCPLDVDGLAPGDCASTRLGPFSIVLHCRPGEVFDLYVFRSFGLALWEWLCDEAAEFGYEVREAG